MSKTEINKKLNNDVNNNFIDVIVKRDEQKIITEKNLKYYIRCGVSNKCMLYNIEYINDKIKLTYAKFRVFFKYE